MSKEAATAEAQAGGEQPGRVRAASTAPSTEPPTRHRNASVQSAAQAVQGAQPRPRDQIVEAREAGRAEGATQEKPRARPTYTPRGQEQPSHAKPPHRGVQPGGSNVTTTQPIERVSTIKQDDGTEAPAATEQQPPAQAHPPLEQHPPARPRVNKSPGELQEHMFHEKRKKRKRRRPMEICIIACCILFWLLVIAVGVGVLVVYLIYRPQPPGLRVTSATLNAGYIDELGGGRRALNSDLTVLAAISNPNKVIHIVLRYMQLDLYFQGSLIGTQAVWPAPLHEGPGGSVLRSVHLVVSEVVMTQEDVMLWRNATGKGGPVVLQLFGQFQTQLNFGRWLPFNYWVYPRCTLWLDPPPGGALRRVRC